MNTMIKPEAMIEALACEVEEMVEEIKSLEKENERLNLEIERIIDSKYNTPHPSK